MRRATLFIPAIAFCLSVPATAQVYSWNITGSGFTGSGTFTLETTTSYPPPFACTYCADGPGYLLTSISGSLNGNVITGLASPDTVLGNDNLFFAQSSGDSVDWWGIGFTTSAGSYDIFGGEHGGHLGDFIAAGGTSGDALFANPIVGSVAPVPEPSTWAMMLLGFACIGVASRRRAAAVARSTAKRALRLPVSGSNV